MSYLITPADVWHALRAVGLKDDAAAFKALMEEALDGATKKLGDHLGIAYGKSAMEHQGFGGLLIEVAPARRDQPIPQCLSGCDDEGEWEYPD